MACSPSTLCNSISLIGRIAGIFLTKADNKTDIHARKMMAFAKFALAYCAIKCCKIKDTLRYALFRMTMGNVSLRVLILNFLFVILNGSVQ